MGFKPKFHFKDVEPSPVAALRVGLCATALAVSVPEKNWEVWGKKKGKKVKVAVEEPLPVLDLNLDNEHDDEVVVPKKAKPEGGRGFAVGLRLAAVIEKHIEHWATRADAREYANDDIVYTRALDKHFGYPTPGDNDSTLACMVPVVRWHGFEINKAGMGELLAKAQAVVANSPVNINKPGEVRAYVTAAMDGTEAIILEESTKKAIWRPSQLGDRGHRAGGRCEGDPGCARCGGTGVLKPGRHPAAIRAKTSWT